MHGSAACKFLFYNKEDEQSIATELSNLSIGMLHWNNALWLVKNTDITC